MTSLPKIIFRRSWLYDGVMEELWRTTSTREKKRGLYPTPEKIDHYIARLRTAWKKDGQRILKSLSAITAIPWLEPEICCYVVGWAKPYSDPLTVPMYAKLPMSQVVDVVTHELIHRLVSFGKYPEKRWGAGMRWLKKLYPKETSNTYSHVPVHAIHGTLYLKLFSKFRMERDRDSLKHLKDYRRAWEIVDELGAKKVIKKFFV